MLLASERPKLHERASSRTTVLITDSISCCCSALSLVEDVMGFVFPRPLVLVVVVLGLLGLVLLVELLFPVLVDLAQAVEHLVLVERPHQYLP